MNSKSVKLRVCPRHDTYKRTSTCVVLVWSRFHSKFVCPSFREVFVAQGPSWDETCSCGTSSMLWYGREWVAAVESPSEVLVEALQQRAPHRRRGSDGLTTQDTTRELRSDTKEAQINNHSSFSHKSYINYSVDDLSGCGNFHSNVERLNSNDAMFIIRWTTRCHFLLSAKRSPQQVFWLSKIFPLCIVDITVALRAPSFLAIPWKGNFTIGFESLFSFKWEGCLCHRSDLQLMNISRMRGIDPASCRVLFSVQMHTSVIKSPRTWKSSEMTARKGLRNFSSKLYGDDKRRMTGDVDAQIVRCFSQLRRRVHTRWKRVPVKSYNNFGRPVEKRVVCLNRNPFFSVWTRIYHNMHNKVATW